MAGIELCTVEGKEWINGKLLAVDLTILVSELTVYI